MIHDYSKSTGAAIIELCEPRDNSGSVVPTGTRLAARFDGRGQDALHELLDSGHKGPVFLGSVMATRNPWRVGHWCDVLPWSPIPDGLEYEKQIM